MYLEYLSTALLDLKHRRETYLSYCTSNSLTCALKARRCFNDQKVRRGKGQALAHHSVISRDLYLLLLEKLMENNWDHPILLAVCYLNPFFREMGFILDDVLSTECESKDEEFTSKLVRK